MDYELAKELKDAGFPQRNTRICNLIEDEIHVVETEFYFPTLSELIEACGENFGVLVQMLRPETHWLACDNEREFAKFQVRGNLPEEAVARLWLELNRKDGN